MLCCLGISLLENVLMDKAHFLIVPYSIDLAPFFDAINREWIVEMFKLERIDEIVLENPQSEIIENGGHILFVSVNGLGIVGTVALLKTGDDEFELTKMGVLKKARGLHAGEFLLKAAIKKARDLGVKNLYLLTNKKCEAAIHLYEKHGFQHDSETMRRFGSEYERCDVAMRYRHPTFEFI